jgi:hypothetical protein
MALTQTSQLKKINAREHCQRNFEDALSQAVYYAGKKENSAGQDD